MVDLFIIMYYNIWDNRVKIGVLCSILFVAWVIVMWWDGYLCVMGVEVIYNTEIIPKTMVTMFDSVQQTLG